jgi:hypothetical protein
MRNKLIVAFTFILMFNNLYSKDITIKISDLPAVARTFITEHYKENLIRIIEQDLDDKDFEVRLKNKTQIDFYSDGVWEKIESKNNKELPKSIVDLLPKEAKTYISKMRPKAKIVKIENIYNKKHWEVEVFSGKEEYELKFDAKGKLISSEKTD